MWDVCSRKAECCFREALSEPSPENDFIHLNSKEGEVGIDTLCRDFCLFLMFDLDESFQFPGWRSLCEYFKCRKSEIPLFDGDEDVKSTESHRSTFH